MKGFLYLCICFWSSSLFAQQHISVFTSIEPGTQSQNLVLPSYHSFHFIVLDGDSLTDGGVMPTNPDFTGYVPISGSSSHGYLSINSESSPGGVTVFEIKLDTSVSKWKIISSNRVDFSSVVGVKSNCSGAVTPWNTILSCEEFRSVDGNADGYYDYGWVVEINPSTHKITNNPGGLASGDKLWAMGNFTHENVTIHSNKRTAYYGVDAVSGYLLKFIADTAEKLYSGKLYAYKGSKSGSGRWVRIKNSTASDCNLTNQRCIDSSCTTFNGIEDVEYNSIDGKTYLAVKGEDRVYRFTDDSYLTGDSVHNFETYVGNMSYTITHTNGSTSTAWGTGNDNLCFDDKGNLWVQQDGSNNHIWMVESDHTQSSPKVKLFAKTPTSSESTGITFTPDYEFMFLSIMHPSSGNTTTQFDAFGTSVKFNKAVTLVVARDSSFMVLPVLFNGLWANYLDNTVKLNWQTACEHLSYGFFIQRSTDLKQWESIGLTLSENHGCMLTHYEFTDEAPKKGTNYYRILQTDMDGSEFISEVVAVNNNQEIKTPYPNPCVPGGIIYIYEEGPYQLMDLEGRILKSGWIHFNNSNAGAILMPQSPGLYFLINPSGTLIKLSVHE